MPAAGRVQLGDRLCAGARRLSNRFIHVDIRRLRGADRRHSEREHQEEYASLI